MKMAVQGRSKSWVNHFFNILSLFYVISMGVLAAYVYGHMHMFMSICLWTECVSVCLYVCLCVWCLQRLEEGVRFSETRVTDSHKP